MFSTQGVYDGDYGSSTIDRLPRCVYAVNGLDSPAPMTHEFNSFCPDSILCLQLFAVIFILHTKFVTKKDEI